MTWEVDPQGNETRRALRACGDAAACPLGAAVVELVEFYHGSNQMRVPQLSYSDYAGHLLRSQTWGLDPNLPIVIDHRYDELGRLQEADQPRFATARAYLAQHLDYDAVGRVTNVTVRDELGHDQNTRTDYHGLTVVSTNPLLQKRTEHRNAIGQLTEVIDAKGGSTKFGYEPFGNLANTWDPNGNKTTVTYDRWGRKTALRDPDLGYIQYLVDPTGMTWAQISARQQGKGKQSAMVYDPLNRMTARYEEDLTSHWVYDVATDSSKGVGQLSEAYTSAGSNKDYERHHTYDTLGRLVHTVQRLSDAAYSSELGYDGWGRVVSQTYQRGADGAKVFGRRYGRTGLLERIERGALVLWRLAEEDASRRATGMVLGNGLKEIKVYDPNTGRLTVGQLEPVAGGMAPVTESYGYDALGNVNPRSLSWSSGGYTEHFTYDELNRLKTSMVGGATLTYEYDAAGSIQSKSDVNGGATYVYPGQGEAAVRPHALIGFGTPGGFSYDDSGNQTAAPGRSATWTSFDMPLQLVKGGVAGSDCGRIAGTGSCFLYGPEHQRVKQVRSDGATLIYAGAQEVESRPGQVTVKTYWPNGIGVEIDRPGASATELNWTYADRLGSPVALTNEAGGIREKLEYDAWGKRRSTGDHRSTDNSIDGVTDSKGYAGHEMLDQLDLVHMNGRVYDPYTARFLSGDPHVTDPTNGQSFNRYSYVWNNPTNLTDPTGFDAAIPSVEIPGCGPSCLMAQARAAYAALQEAARQSGRYLVKNPGAATVRFGAAVVKRTAIGVLATFPGNAGTKDHAGEMGNWGQKDDGKRLFTPAQIEALRKDAEEGKSGEEAGPQDANDKPSLLDEKGEKHILDGDATGGGHRPGTGKPGKSEFPSDWSDDKIKGEISDVATDPNSTRTPGRGGRTIVQGTRDGVDITVVIEPESKGGRIVTGFPTNVPRNPK